MGSNRTGALATQGPGIGRPAFGVVWGGEGPSSVERGQALTLGQLPGWWDSQEKVVEYGVESELGSECCPNPRPQSG